MSGEFDIGPLTWVKGEIDQALEKSLGALRAGIRCIIVPEKNKKELSEVPANVRRKIRFITVKGMDEVLSHALLNKKAARRGRVKH